MYVVCVGHSFCLKCIKKNVRHGNVLCPTCGGQLKQTLSPNRTAQQIIDCTLQVYCSNHCTWIGSLGELSSSCQL